MSARKQIEALADRSRSTAPRRTSCLAHLLELCAEVTTSVKIRTVSPLRRRGQQNRNLIAAGASR